MAKRALVARGNGQALIEHQTGVRRRPIEAPPPSIRFEPTPIRLQHRSISWDAFEHWEYDYQRCLLIVTHGIQHWITVSGEGNPRIGDYLLTRVDPVTWRLSPARFIVQGPQWVSQPFPLPWPIETSPVILTDGPPHIHRELALLLTKE